MNQVRTPINAEVVSAIHRKSPQMSARSLVLAACAALAMLTATAPKAMAQYYPQDDWRARHWEHEMRERARWEAEARERAAEAEAKAPKVLPGLKAPKATKAPRALTHLPGSLLCSS